MNVFGAKGMGDGSSMLTPAAIANAVADALQRDDIVLPLNLQRLWALANGKDVGQQAPPARHPQKFSDKGALRGSGDVALTAPVGEVWRRLTDPNELAAILPGCRDLRQTGPDKYSARVVIGVAGIRGMYDAVIELHDKDEPHSVRLVGNASGALGFGAGSGLVRLTADLDGSCTRLHYDYAADVGGKVAAVGQRMLGTVTDYLIGQFFTALERRIAPQAPGGRGWLKRLFGAGGAL